VKILILAAHPDDEILGCGGTVARKVAEGDEAVAVILGEGITSRYTNTNSETRDQIRKLQEKSRESGRIIGIRETRYHNIPDNKFDTVPLLDIAKIIEDEIEQAEPDVIFTHHGGDLNIDHTLVFRAVMTAARPMKGNPVKEIYCFQIPSSTDWAFQRISPAWKPNTFFDISATLETKIRALKQYDSEMRPFPHPRSYKNVQNIAVGWGSVCGTNAAEAFELIRAIR
jgi:LmbE family N-acetylglucosaminyl deacetylase